MEKIILEINGEYGTDEGEIRIYDESENEIVTWISDEWIEDPSVVYVICSALMIGYFQGANALKEAMTR